MGTSFFGWRIHGFMAFAEEFDDFFQIDVEMLCFDEQRVGTLSEDLNFSRRESGEGVSET